jgi:hypothetical protein
MRIFFGIAVSMMHAVHNRIRPWYQVRRSLRKPRHKIKSSFPVFGCGKHFMRSKTMEKKGMKKQREKPMAEKENKNRGH